MDLLKIAFGALLASVVSYIRRRGEERREYVHRRVDLIEAEIRTMESRGTRYWVTDPSDPLAPVIASEIKRTRSRIGLEIGRLSAQGLRCKPCNDRLTAFAQAITDGDFEVATRSTDLNRIETIGLAADELIAEIRDGLQII